MTMVTADIERLGLPVHNVERMRLCAIDKDDNSKNCIIVHVRTNKDGTLTIVNQFNKEQDLHTNTTPFPQLCGDDSLLSHL